MTRLKTTSFGRDRRGVAAVEFAIVGPVFLLILFAVLGVGLDGFYQIIFDDSVRDATRQLQIFGPAAQDTTGANFRIAVCKEFGPLAGSNCTTRITFNVQASNVKTGTPAASGGFTALTPVALGSGGAYPNAFLTNGNPYVDYAPILAQVAYPLPFVLPLIGPLLTGNGTNSISTQDTVIAEPF